MLEKCNFIKESCRRVVGVEIQTTFACLMRQLILMISIQKFKLWNCHLWSSHMIQQRSRYNPARSFQKFLQNFVENPVKTICLIFFFLVTFTSHEVDDHWDDSLHSTFLWRFSVVCAHFYIETHGLTAFHAQIVEKKTLWN